MKNQEFHAKETKDQVLPNFGICCRELRGSKLQVLKHGCAVSTLSMLYYYYCCKRIFKISAYFYRILGVLLSFAFIRTH